MNLPDFASKPGESFDIGDLELEILTSGTCKFYESKNKALDSKQHAYLSVIIHMAGSFQPILTKKMAEDLKKSG